MRWPYLFYLIMIVAGLLGGCKGREIFVKQTEEARFVRGSFQLKQELSEDEVDFDNVTETLDKITPYLESLDKNYETEFVLLMNQELQSRHLFKSEILKHQLEMAVYVAFRWQCNRMLRSLSLDERKDAFDRLKELLSYLLPSPNKKLLEDLEASTLTVEQSPLTAITELQKELIRLYGLNLLQTLEDFRQLCQNNMNSQECLFKQEMALLAFDMIEGELMSNNRAWAQSLKQMIQKPKELEPMEKIKERLQNTLPLISY